jgi:hypothetical protein
LRGRLKLERIADLESLSGTEREKHCHTDDEGDSKLHSRLSREEDL